jgi:hypothetical protein
MAVDNVNMNNSGQFSEARLFDTGATVHATPNDNALLNTQVCSARVEVAQGTEVQGTKKRFMVLHSTCGACITLTGVLVILSFKKNIISGPNLVRNTGYIVTMSGTVATVTNDILQQLHFRHNKSNQLWYSRCSRQEPPLTTDPSDMFSTRNLTSNRPDFKTCIMQGQ